MTTVKHRNFVVEPIGEKSVMEIAGIGNVYGAKLSEQGFDKAYILLGNFLLFKKNEELFTGWLTEACGMSRNHALNCYNCLREWSDAFL